MHQLGRSSRAHHGLELIAQHANTIMGFPARDEDTAQTRTLKHARAGQLMDRLMDGRPLTALRRGLPRSNRAV
ncbi:hypothetical protein LAJ19_20420 (plasmid) [Deinococcus taeanensis]|uniref:hypothetical protein n=1 Tax=Deinococcus taeanensis TaxID=2737050 RepID=UPI001CDCDBEF|nr:hypothetical protein [Deinococcus taeanensis]UBV45494.1 hypothetical protein LAJ19_20420 [Deinococcus taeanensis]